MVKALKFFLKEAARADRAAAAKGDRASEQFANLAEAFRAQAVVLKQKKPKKTKKTKKNRSAAVGHEPRKNPPV